MASSDLPLPCPHCLRSTAQLLEGLSLTDVNYYRCEHCCHIWTTPKDAAKAPNHDSALRPAKAENRPIHSRANKHRAS